MSQPIRYWIQSESYNLLHEDQQILLSPTAWLNDSIMDAAQKLICNSLGLEYQSVLNVQKRDALKFYPVSNEHVQLMHDGNDPWILSLCSNGQVQICDSLRRPFSRATTQSLNAIYRHYKCDGKLLVNHLDVQRQNDGHML